MLNEKFFEDTKQLLDNTTINNQIKFWSPSH